MQEIFMLPEPATVVKFGAVDGFGALISPSDEIAQCVYHRGQFMALSIDIVGESSISILLPTT